MFAKGEKRGKLLEIVLLLPESAQEPIDRFIRVFGYGRGGRARSC